MPQRRPSGRQALPLTGALCLTARAAIRARTDAQPPVTFVASKYQAVTPAAAPAAKQLPRSATAPRAEGGSRGSGASCATVALTLCGLRAAGRARRTALGAEGAGTVVDTDKELAKAKAAAEAAQLELQAAKLRAEAEEMQRTVAKERRVTRARQLLEACGIDNCHAEDLDRGPSAAEKERQSINAEQLREKLGEVVGVKLTKEQTVELMTACRPAQAAALSFEELCSLEFDTTLDRFAREAQAAKQKAKAEEAARQAEEAKKKALEQPEIVEVYDGPINDDREFGTRILCIFAYALPLLDGLQFGFPLAGLVPALVPVFQFLAVPERLLDAIPFGQLILFFAMSIASGNRDLPRLLRLNLQQACLLDIALFLPSILFQLGSFIAGGSGRAPPELQVLVFIILMLSIFYSVGASLLGKDPDGLPGISQAAKDRVDRGI